MVLYVTITTPSFPFTFFKHLFVLMVDMTQEDLILDCKRLSNKTQQYCIFVKFYFFKGISLSFQLALVVVITFKQSLNRTV